MIDKIKAYLTPILASMLGLLIWTDLQMIKAKLDVLMEERSGINEKLKYYDRAITDLQNMFPRKPIIYKPILFIKDEKYPKIVIKKHS
jgi:hypothetical protein